jgi:hypothetical protein
LVGVAVLAGCGSSERAAPPPRTGGSVGTDEIVVKEHANQRKLTPAEYGKKFDEALKLLKTECPSSCTFTATA